MMPSPLRSAAIVPDTAPWGIGGGAAATSASFCAHAESARIGNVAMMIVFIRISTTSHVGTVGLLENGQCKPPIMRPHISANVIEIAENTKKRRPATGCVVYAMYDRLQRWAAVLLPPSRVA
jgi:hypothetical protein